MSVDISEYIEVLKRQNKELLKNKPFIDAVASTHDMQMTRIYFEQKKSDGSKIGKYNTTDPLYVNPTTSPGKSFTTLGKGKKSKFKNGKTHKTRLFKHYLAYRTKIGKLNGINVNLDLSGELRTNNTNSLREVKKGEWVTGADTVHAKKMRGNEDRFGIIADLTKKEQREFIRLQEEGLSDILNN